LSPRIHPAFEFDLSEPRRIIHTAGLFLCGKKTRWVEKTPGKPGG
jgi:hypothetical protein